jgi:hypothetical protein
MGVTYKAIDVHLRCPVALKVISERYLGDESARLRLWTGVRSARDRNARLAEQRRSDRSPGDHGPPPR